MQTVDGSPFQCYGKKELSIRINRKEYKIPAVIAKVKCPILGFDFIDKYKLDTVWGEFGDLYLRDKKAQIKKRLEHVTVPHKSIPQFSNAIELTKKKENLVVHQHFETLLPKAASLPPDRLV